MKKFSTSVRNEWGSSRKQQQHPLRGTWKGPGCISAVAVKASGYRDPRTSRSFQASSSPAPGLWHLQKMQVPGLTTALPPLWGPEREGSQGLELKPLLFYVGRTSLAHFLSTPLILSLLLLLPSFSSCLLPRLAQSFPKPGQNGRERSALGGSVS